MGPRLIVNVILFRSETRRQVSVASGTRRGRLWQRRWVGTQGWAVALGGHPGVVEALCSKGHPFGIFPMVQKHVNPNEEPGKGPW